MGFDPKINLDVATQADSLGHRVHLLVGWLVGLVWITGFKLSGAAFHGATVSSPVLLKHK